MDLVEAAPIIGIFDIHRTYFGIKKRSIGNTTIPFAPPNETEDHEEERQSWSSWTQNVLIILAVLGTFFNLMFISAFFATKHLKKRGYRYLICLAIADIVMTAVVMPVTIYGSDDNCPTMHVVAQAAAYSYSLFYMLAAIEAHIRLTRSGACYSSFMSKDNKLIALNTLLSVCISMVGICFSLDYDYCNRIHQGDIWFRVTTGIAFYLIPFIVTACILGLTFCTLRDRVIKLTRFKRYAVTERDIIFSTLYIGSYTTFIASWIPYAVVVTFYPDVPHRDLYPLVWIGILRSTFTSLVFCIAHKSLRSAIWAIARYVFCNKELNYEPNRNRRVAFNTRHQQVIFREDTPPLYL